MRLAIPDSVRQLPLDRPEQAIREFTGLLAELRDAPSASVADLEPIATEAVETALREGAFLMAVVTPDGAAPALLTGVVLEVPPSWDPDTAESLRDALEDIGGPDVRETLALDTRLGPAVIVQRVPGVEQARERRTLTLQLQAFIPEPGTGRMLLLTLACPATQGWATHQVLFGELVASAQPSDESLDEAPGEPSGERSAPGGPVRRSSREPVPAGARRRTRPPVEEESFEEHTYRL